MLRETGRLSVLPLSAPPAPDFVYTAPSGKEVAIRIIMPNATTVNFPHRQLASSICVTRLLEAAGWTVVEVRPFFSAHWWWVRNGMSGIKSTLSWGTC